MSGWFTGTLDFGCGPMTSAGSYDAFVVKLDADGTCIWSHRYGGPEMEWVQGLAADKLGNVYFSLMFPSTVSIAGRNYVSRGGFDALVARLSP